MKLVRMLLVETLRYTDAQLLFVDDARESSELH